MTMDKDRHMVWPYHVRNLVRILECRRNYTKLNPGHTERETENPGECSTFIDDTTILPRAFSLGLISVLCLGHIIIV